MARDLREDIRRWRESEGFGEEALLYQVTESLAATMKTHRVSRRELARRLGVTPPMVTKWLRGENMTLRTLSRIARALGCDVEFALKTAKALGLWHPMRGASRHRPKLVPVNVDEADAVTGPEELGRVA